MKLCPTCKATYADDANFCPKETCATPTGPQRLQTVTASAPVPDTKSRFQIGARLGGSSTGEVYQATDSQTGATVAYKIINSDVLPNAASLARAEREFKQLMRVQSPRIATIIDCGKTADERLYVAMAMADGEPLERVLRSGAMTLERAKAIVSQIGQALLEAQKAGIVHRDVSPKNVLVSSSGDVKLINFPIAKPINDKAAGVAAYLSPEQVQGKPVDQRSNTYNLAAVFYHLLTGEPPFQGTAETVLELHVSSPPLAPSQRRPEAALTPEVDRVILKALDKSSSRRHLTLRLFLSEVDALVPPVAQQAGAGAGKDAGGGFARTMLFAGGQAEVASLVAKAIAARGGSPAMGVPVTAAAAPAVSPPPAASPPVAAAAPTPAVTARRIVTPSATPTASSPPPAAARVSPPAATVAGPGPSAPAPQAPLQGTNGTASGEMFNDRMARLTPPPVTPFPPPPAPEAAPPVISLANPPQTPDASPAGPTPISAARAEAAAAAGKGATGGKGAAFRETLWFKKGDVEHMIAEARAKMATQGAKPGEGEPGPDEKPIEDRYVDDGSLTSDDRKKFSLRTGGTATALPTVRPAAIPGESMSAEDVMREVSGSRRGIVLGVAAVIVVAVVVAVLMMMRNHPAAAPTGTAPAASAVPAPPTAPPPKAPEPAAAAAEPPAKAEATPPKAAAPSDKRSSHHKVDRHNRR